jgi:sec-independent protein translocase protein TatA
MTLAPALLGSLFLAGLPGQWEWLIVLFIILILFGRRLPGVARSLGQGISSFKKGLNDPLDEERDESKKNSSSDKPSDPHAGQTSDA